MKNVHDLDTLFDDPAYRAKPIVERLKVTNLLENLLEEIVREAKPDLFLEVGAFEAQFSRRMKSKYRSATVIALEANPRVYEKFEQDLKSVGVNYINVAVSSEEGVVEFFIPDVIAGAKMPHIGRMGSLREVALRESSTVKVRVQSDLLDNITKGEEFSKACVWIDVEGLVDNVILGGQTTISKSSIVYAELETAPVWHGQSLAAENIRRLEEMGFVMVARDCQKWFQYNSLFLEKNLASKKEVVELVSGYCSEAIEVFKSSAG